MTRNGRRLEGPARERRSQEGGWRNPSFWRRRLFVGLVFAMPGAVAGGLAALAIEWPVLCILVGAGVGISGRRRASVETNRHVAAHPPLRVQRMRMGDISSRRSGIPMPDSIRHRRLVAES